MQTTIRTETLLVCDEPSPLTGRVYPREEVEKMVENYQEKIVNDVAAGALDPKDPHRISLGEVSHKVTDMHLEGNEVKVEYQILTTPMGAMLQDMLNAGARMRISPNMTGCVEKVDGKYQASDLTLLSTSMLPAVVVTQESTAVEDYDNAMTVLNLTE